MKEIAKGGCDGGSGHRRGDFSGLGVPVGGGVAVRVDDLAGVFLAQQSVHQTHVHGVAGAIGFHVPNQRPAQQREIANDVQNLVAAEFVG